jgi:hypothetical protein
MDHSKSQLKSPTQTLARNDGMSHDHETESYWDRLTEDDMRLIWPSASGKDVREVAADVTETRAT